MIWPKARIHLLMSSYATMMPLTQAGKIRVIGSDKPQAGRHRHGRSDRGRGGLPVSRHGQPDRHVRPARNAECAAREHRRRHPGRGRRPIRRSRPGWRRPARSSMSAARPNSPPASRKFATSSPPSPRRWGSRRQGSKARGRQHERPRATSTPPSPTTTCANGSRAPNCSARCEGQGRQLAGGHRARRRGGAARRGRALRGVRGHRRAAPRASAC